MMRVWECCSVIARITELFCLKTDRGVSHVTLLELYSAKSVRINTLFVKRKTAKAVIRTEDHLLTSIQRLTARPKWLTNFKFPSKTAALICDLTTTTTTTSTTTSVGVALC